MEHRKVSMALLAQALGAAPMRGGLIREPLEISTAHRRITSKISIRRGRQPVTVSAVVSNPTAVELSVSQQVNYA